MAFSILESADLSIFLLVLVAALLALGLSRRLLRVSIPQLVLGIIGLILGLWAGSLLRPFFEGLPGLYGRWLPLIAHAFVAVLLLDLFVAQSPLVERFFRRLTARFLPPEDIDGEPVVVVDTSSLIDGRIEGLAETGFIFGKVIVPKFVLDELQKISDSADSLKRSRGRRGLDVLSNLQKIQGINLEISEEEPRGKGVDTKLVALARRRGAKILTVDYNLNRVAQLQKVEVLNVNELSEVIKPVVLPGERIQVKVVQRGKERGQGVGYLPDGTMIVVEGGADLVGKEVEAEVVRIFQTVAGKMVFVQPKR
jgi:uncharacterized protein YacL